MRRGVRIQEGGEEVAQIYQRGLIDKYQRPKIGLDTNSWTSGLFRSYFEKYIICTCPDGQVYQVGDNQDGTAVFSRFFLF